MLVGDVGCEAPQKVRINELRKREEVGFKVIHLGKWVGSGHGARFKAGEVTWAEQLYRLADRRYCGLSLERLTDHIDWDVEE